MRLSHSLILAGALAVAAPALAQDNATVTDNAMTAPTADVNVVGNTADNTIMTSPQDTAVPQDPTTTTTGDPARPHRGLPWGLLGLLGLAGLLGTRKVKSDR